MFPLSQVIVEIRLQKLNVSYGFFLCYSVSYGHIIILNYMLSLWSQINFFLMQQSA